MGVRPLFIWRGPAPFQPTATYSLFYYTDRLEILEKGNVARKNY